MKTSMMSLSTRVPRWLVRFDSGGLNELAAQQKQDDDSQEDIDSCENNEWRGQAVHGCDGFLRSHDTINDPRLPPQLGDDPTRFNSQESQRPYGDNRTQKPLGIRQAPALQTLPAYAYCQQEHH